MTSNLAIGGFPLYRQLTRRLLKAALLSARWIVRFLVETASLAPADFVARYTSCTSAREGAMYSCISKANSGSKII